MERNLTEVVEQLGRVKAVLANLVEHRAVPKRVIELLTAQNTQIAKGVPCVRVTARKAA